MNYLFHKTILMAGIVFTGVLWPFKILTAQTTDKSEDLSFPDYLTTLNPDKLFKPYVGIETWATFSMGEESDGEEYANRTDISFRRFRFGGSGSPYNWLSYNFQLHFDRLGEDNFSSTKGSFDDLGIWNAYLTARLLKNSELLNLEGGYFWTAISREFNTSPWAVGSFDKTRADWYLRNFITGKGNGIESGLALGGLKNFEKFGVSYRIGTYEPLKYSSSKYASRLYTARIMISFGDPEQTKYKYMLSGNQWRKRKGITIGFGTSTQSDGKLTDTTYFDKSFAYGADVLINYCGLQIDGEYFAFNRSVPEMGDFDGMEWHIRIGYTCELTKTYIEPCITYDNYEGEGSKSVFKYIGSDNTIDFGLNWYLNKDKLKLSLHYMVQEGSVSSNTGDLMGIACQVKL